MRRVEAVGSAAWAGRLRVGLGRGRQIHSLEETPGKLTRRPSSRRRRRRCAYLPSRLVHRQRQWTFRRPLCATALLEVVKELSVKSDVNAGAVDEKEPARLVLAAHAVEATATGNRLSRFPGLDFSRIVRDMGNLLRGPDFLLAAHEECDPVRNTACGALPECRCLRSEVGRVRHPDCHDRTLQVPSMGSGGAVRARDSRLTGGDAVTHARPWRGAGNALMRAPACLRATTLRHGWSIGWTF